MADSVVHQSTLCPPEFERVHKHGMQDNSTSSSDFPDDQFNSWLISLMPFSRCFKLTCLLITELRWCILGPIIRFDLLSNDCSAASLIKRTRFLTCTGSELNEFLLSGKKGMICTDARMYFNCILQHASLLDNKIV